MICRIFRTGLELALELISELVLELVQNWLQNWFRTGSRTDLELASELALISKFALKTTQSLNSLQRCPSGTVTLCFLAFFEMEFFV